MRQPQHAEYGITEVCFDQDEKHIVEVKARPSVSGVPNGPDRLMGEELRLNRAEVVFWIDSDAVFYTFKLTGDWAWKGAKVQIVNVGGVRYLRTAPDQLPGDNLGDLPRYPCAPPSL